MAYDEIKDLAVLKLGAATSSVLPSLPCSPTDDMVGSTIYAVGYPGLAENILRTPLPAGSLGRERYQRQYQPSAHHLGDWPNATTN